MTAEKPIRTKVITLKNLNRIKQCDEAMENPSSYLYLAQSSGQISRTRKMRLVLVLLLIG